MYLYTTCRVLRRRQSCASQHCYMINVECNPVHSYKEYGEDLNRNPVQVSE